MCKTKMEGKKLNKGREKRNEDEKSKILRFLVKQNVVREILTKSGIR